MSLFKKKKENEVETLFKNFDVDYHYKELERALGFKGYKIKCLKLTRFEVESKVLIVDEF